MKIKKHTSLAQFLLLILFSMILLGCSGEDDNPPSSVTDIDLSNLSVFDDTGEYADQLVVCAQADTSSESCTLNTLPLIGLEAGDASALKIMQRVVVSHDWMGERFKQLLEEMPVETLPLFNSVSIIVIDDDIRPSFYWTLTGAIYLDPANLWLTNQEKFDITQKPDYRSDFGKELAVIPAWRYVINNQRAYQYYPLDGGEERTVDDIKLRFYSLVFHELAHANDFAPASSFYLLDRAATIVEALNKISNNRISDILYQSYPLQSDELYGLGAVLYHGKIATAEQKQITPSYAGALMHNDAANSMYSYSNRREDLAELFEAILMKKYFSLEMDMAFVNNPQGDDLVCDDYIIGWGSRNRLANPLVKVRAEQVAEQILLGVNWSEFFDDVANGVGTEILLQTDVDWCSILDSAQMKSYHSPPRLRRVY